MGKYLYFLYMMIFCSCHTAQHYFEKGKYDDAFKLSSSKLMKDPVKHHKEIEVFHASFNKLNQQNMAAISQNTLQNETDFNQFKQTLSYLTRRQDEVIKLYNAFDLEIPKHLLYWQDDNALQLQLDRNINNYHWVLFEKNKSNLLSENNLSHAHAALNSLNKMDNTFNGSELYHDLILDLFATGAYYNYVSVKNLSQTDFDQRILKEATLENIGGTFNRYTSLATDDLNYRIEFEVKQIQLDKPSYSYSSTDHSIEVIARYKEVTEKKEIPQPPIQKTVEVWCDSVWLKKLVYENQPPKIIEEKIQKPVYETVGGTEHNTLMEQRATASIAINIFDAQDELIYKNHFKSSYSYCDKAVTYEGDDRAKPLYIILTNSFISEKSSDELMLSLLTNLESDIYCFLRKHNKTASP